MGSRKIRVVSPKIRANITCLSFTCNVGDMGIRHVEIVHRIAKRSRLSDEVADLLRDRILCGELPPGARLPQVEVAEALQVSRTPLREAFRILEHEGLMETSATSNTAHVLPTDLDSVLTALEVRCIVDPMAARLLAARPSPTSVEQLRAAVREMDSATSGEVPTASYIRAHAAFHAGIALYCGSDALARFAPTIRSSVRPWSDPDTGDALSGCSSHRSGRPTSHPGHGAILAAIEERRPDDAERAAREHAMSALDAASGRGGARPVLFAAGVGGGQEALLLASQEQLVDRGPR
jgi:DNA-binding GntR family transcriptional regulator